MKFYDVLVNGENFKLETEDGITAMGFYVMVYVAAEEEKDAEFKAMEVLKGEEKLRSVIRNDKVDPPKMFMENLVTYEKMPKSHKGNLHRTGFAWYEDGDDGGRSQSREIFNQKGILDFVNEWINAVRTIKRKSFAVLISRKSAEGNQNEQRGVDH